MDRVLGINDLKYKHRKGRSITEKIHANIESDLFVIDNDSWCTYEIQKLKYPSRVTIDAIMIEVKIGRSPTRVKSCLSATNSIKS